jgi:hypothetical protein
MGVSLYERDPGSRAYVLQHQHNGVIDDFESEGAAARALNKHEVKDFDSESRGKVTVEFRRHSDGMVWRSKTAPDDPAPMEVPLTFNKGSWSAYLKGEEVELAVTDEGYRIINRRNAAAANKNRGAIKDLAAGAGFRISGSSAEAQWENHSKITLSQDSYRETPQTLTETVTYWLVPGRR